MQKALSVFLLTSLVAGLVIVFSGDFSSAQTPTSVKGIIGQDTTWKNGVYVFDGSVGVPEGVTLTVEAGVLVDVGAYNLQVNGTLIAQGTDTQKVVFTSDDKQSSGIVLVYGNPTCTFENVVLSGVSFSGQSTASNAKLDLVSCILNESAVNVWGITTISKSYIDGAVQLRGTATLSDSNFDGGIDIAGTSSETSFEGSFSISGNNITNQQGGIVLTVGASGTIKDNLIYGGSTGIAQANGSQTMSAVIENNIITNNDIGILTRTENDDSTIKGNTITDNRIGLSNPSSKQTIIGNDIEDNSQYNIYAGVSAVNAVGNFWGATDRAVIARTIYDSNDDFNLGTVVYIPFLSEANSNSPQKLTSAVPTQLDGITYQVGGQTNTTINGLEVGIIVTVAAVVLVAVIAVRAHKRHRSTT